MLIYQLPINVTQILKSTRTEWSSSANILIVIWLYLVDLKELVNFVRSKDDKKSERGDIDKNSTDNIKLQTFKSDQAESKRKDKMDNRFSDEAN